MSYWTWDANSRRYRVTSEGASVLGQAPGTFVSQAKLEDLSAQLQNNQYAQVQTLTQALVEGRINLEQFGSQFSGLVAENHAMQYVMARGGFNQMSQGDWTSLDNVLLKQATFLQGFLEDIQIGRYSVVGLLARAKMYVSSTWESFWRGLLGHLDMQLPAYPGDGTSECKTNCNCRWRIVETENTINCYWELGPTEHCPTCADRAKVWAPLQILKLSNSYVLDDNRR